MSAQPLRFAIRLFAPSASVAPVVILGSPVNPEPAPPGIGAGCLQLGFPLAEFGEKFAAKAVADSPDAKHVGEGVTAPEAPRKRKSKRGAAKPKIKKRGNVKVKVF